MAHQSGNTLAVTPSTGKIGTCDVVYKAKHPGIIGGCF